MRTALIVHIIGGGLGLVLGAVALSAMKGGRLHRKSGMLFVYAIVLMGVTGAGIAAFTGVETSVIMGLFTAYLVITSLTTVRPGAAGSRWLYLGPMLVGLAVGLASIMLGIDSIVRGEEVRDGGMPVPMLFVFGAIALLAVLSDIRVMRSGGFTVRADLQGICGGCVLRCSLRRLRSSWDSQTNFRRSSESCLRL